MRRQIEVLISKGKRLADFVYRNDDYGLIINVARAVADFDGAGDSVLVETGPFLPPNGKIIIYSDNEASGGSAWDAIRD